MDDSFTAILFTVAWVTLFLICIGTLGFMVFILIAFIVGQCQRMSRQRLARKVAERKAQAARYQIAKRDRLLTKEKAAREALVAGETLHYEQVRELFENGVE